MPNIILTRIDNRLIHGQVATQWSGAIGINLILVANDEVASNPMRQGLMDMAAPSYAGTRYWTIEKTINNIHRASDAQKIFIIVDNPQDVLKLVVGNMHMSEGKRQVATSVAIDDADAEAFRKLRDLGVEIFIQRTPDIAKEDPEVLFK